MPRGKHTVWEQGTHVPLIVRFPQELGSVVDDLVSLSIRPLLSPTRLHARTPPADSRW